MNHSTPMYSGKTENETYSASTTLAVSGSYYEHVKEKAAFWFDKIIQRQNKEGQIVIADYGTADGVGFFVYDEQRVRYFRACCKYKVFLFTPFCPVDKEADEHVRRMSGIDILMYLIDQPSNDFNLLVRGITGSATSNLKSGSGLSENVSVAVIGRTMYEKCLPRNSLDICFSTMALHWLSQKPCDIKNGLTHKLACKEEEKAFQEMAKQDWHQFLVNRGKELKKGGLCMILCLTYHPEDDDDTNSHIQITHIWKRLLDSGVITQEEFVNTTLQVYIRRPEDLSYPFNHDDQDIASLGLRLLSSDRIIHQFTGMMNNYSKTDEEHKKKYADAVVGYVRPWLRNALYRGLSTERSEVSRNKICDEFFHILWETAYRKEIKVSYAPFQHIIIQKS